MGDIMDMGYLWLNGMVLDSSKFDGVSVEVTKKILLISVGTIFVCTVVARNKWIRHVAMVKMYVPFLAYGSEISWIRGTLHG